MNQPRVHYWMGRPMTELSRDDLMDAINYLADRVDELTTKEAIEDRAVGSVRRLMGVE